jgi:hypothetical protein
LHSANGIGDTFAVFGVEKGVEAGKGIAVLAAVNRFQRRGAFLGGVAAELRRIR